MSEQEFAERIFLIEQDGCIRCASCSTIAPEIFFVEEDGARVLRQPANASELNSAMAALFNCPTAAIKQKRVG